MYFRPMVTLFIIILSMYTTPTRSSPASNPAPPTSLSPRSRSTVGTVYWDTNLTSTIRVIFNLSLTNAFTQAMLNSNIDISQAVITTFKAYVSSRGSTWLSGLIESATIYGQLGKQPRDVLREPNGVLTLAFTVVLKEGGGALARYGVVNELRNWLEQDGNSAVIKRVANAARVGSGTIVKKGEDGKRDGSEGASQNMLKTNFCLAGGEERSWTFVGGEVDALTEERVYCWSAISRGNLLLRYGGDLGTL